MRIKSKAPQYEEKELPTAAAAVAATARDIKEGKVAEACTQPFFYDCLGEAGRSVECARTQELVITTATHAPYLLILGAIIRSVGCYYVVVVILLFFFLNDDDDDDDVV